jgi:hypothetical protein
MKGKRITDKQKAYETLCICGHTLRLHGLAFLAPCIGRGRDWKDIDKMELCDCRGFNAAAMRAERKNP